MVNCWREQIHKFKTEYLLIWQKYLSTWTSIKYFGLQVQVSTKYFWILYGQVQVSTKYSIICIKYQVPITSTLLDPNPDVVIRWGMIIWLRLKVNLTIWSFRITFTLKSSPSLSNITLIMQCLSRWRHPVCHVLSGLQSHARFLPGTTICHQLWCHDWDDVMGAFSTSWTWGIIQCYNSAVIILKKE